MVEREVAFRVDARLDRCEEKGAAISWPIPLDNHLDALLELTDNAGQRTTRKELVAAIVLSAPRDGVWLAQLVTDYRQATVAAVAPTTAGGDNVVPFRVNRPGPRPRRSG